MKKAFVFIAFILVAVLITPQPTVLADNLVSITNLSGTVYKEDLIGIKVNISNNIQPVQVVSYVDGDRKETKTSAPYVFDFSDITLGDHNITVRVFESNGRISSDTKSIKVIKRAPEQFFSTNFTGYNGIAFDGMIQHSSNSYPKGGVIDSGHGDSCLIGSDGTTAGEAYCGVTYDTTFGKVTYKIDFYPSRNDIKGYMLINGTTLVGSGQDLAALSFRSNGTVRATTDDSYVEWNYSAEEWYTLEMILNVSTGTYDIYWNGEKKASDYKLPTKISKLDNCRLQFEYPINESGFVAVDNVKVDKLTDYPIIESVSYTAPCISVTTNVQMGFPSTGIQDFKIYSDAGEIEYTSAAIDSNNARTVIITLDDNLEPGKNYKLVMEGTAKLAKDNMVMGDSTTAFFTSPNKAFDVLDGSFSNGPQIAFTTTIKNETNTDEAVSVLLVIFKNNRVESVTEQKEIINAGQTKPVTVSAPLNYGNGRTAKAYVLGGNNGIIPISNKVFVFQ